MKPIGINKTVFRRMARQVCRRAVWAFATLALNNVFIWMCEYHEKLSKTIAIRAAVRVRFGSGEGDVTSSPITSARTVLLIATDSRRRDGGGSFHTPCQVPRHAHARPAASIPQALQETLSRPLVTQHHSCHVSHVLLQQTVKKNLQGEALQFILWQDLVEKLTYSCSGGLRLLPVRGCLLTRWRGLSRPGCARPQLHTRALVWRGLSR